MHHRGMQQILKAFTVPSTPPGAVQIEASAASVQVLRPKLSAGSLAIPIDMDEIQADVHLVHREEPHKPCRQRPLHSVLHAHWHHVDVPQVYSLASPAYLATPPLLSCTHAVSSIVHNSAIRLTAQNAANENELAHQVSELLAAIDAHRSMHTCMLLICANAHVCMCSSC